MCRRNEELCEMTTKDPSKFWRLFKTQHSNACPVELSVQFEAFRALMGAEPCRLPRDLLFQVYLPMTLEMHA